MDIRFFDDPLESPKPREDVRFKRLGLFVYPDRRRVAVGFDITPFRESPSIEVDVANASGEPAGSMSIVNVIETNFTLTLHLRDPKPTEKYTLTAVLYYASPESDRIDVHSRLIEFDVTVPGEQPA